ncbi:MAG TPA: LysR family transcriptional regulator [Rhizomicrobium sp.]|nr:LysR family transcriptional regulator [Rhizomicrobium sp.]
MRPPKKHNGLRAEQWAGAETPTVPDWEAARIFLEVARCGSFRAASQKLRQSVNALRRRIDDLEADLGVAVLTRYMNGVQPTEEGAKIFRAVQQMENASFDLLQARERPGKQVEGEVRLSITEGMGTHWLLPKVKEFQRSNPQLAISMRCGQKPADLLRLEADLSVQLRRPKEPGLKVVKLGCLHVMLFAARSYLDVYGHPASIADLKDHRLVIQSDDERQYLEIYEKVLGGLSPEKLVAFRCNTSTTHMAATMDGIGIGALPTYLQAIGGALVPVLDVGVSHDIWLVFRADAKRVPRIRKTIEWVTQCYNPRRFPWFRDEFIHPDRFHQLYAGEPLTSLVSGFRDLR